MSVEAQRRRHFLGGFDITFFGEHPWFAELSRMYCDAGHNVMQLGDGPEDAYRYTVTRAHPKRLAVFAGAAAALLHTAASVRQDSETTTVVLIDDAEQRSHADRAFGPSDWVVATSAHAWEWIRGRNASRELRASSASALAYPLLALANRLSWEMPGRREVHAP
jgi:hypothetical protein